MKKIIMVLAVILLLLTPVFLKSKASYETTHEPLPKEVILSEYDIELGEWIEKLSRCESGNNPKAINQFDGGSRSVGYVQYKDATWAGYVKKFNLSYTAEDIWSKEAQIEVTKHVITKDYAWKNWYNCTTKVIGLPPRP